MKQQIILLRGGTPKENYANYYEFLEKYEINPYEEKKTKWSDTLAEDLGEGFEVLEIKRPNKDFADYKAWEIVFNKYIPFIRNGAIFVGHSLGGSFFLKYFELHPCLITKFSEFNLIAPAIEDSEIELLGSFKPDLSFKNLKKFQNKITIFASKDDFIVPFKEIETLKKYLPDANYKIFDNKGHFLQEKFYELLNEIKKG